MDRFVRAFNEDGRDFILASTKRMKEWHNTVKEIIIQPKASSGYRWKNKSEPAANAIPVPALVSHFVMNLPATAIKFLGSLNASSLTIDAFRGLYRENQDLFKPHMHIATDDPCSLFPESCSIVRQFSSK